MFPIINDFETEKNKLISLVGGFYAYNSNDYYENAKEGVEYRNSGAFGLLIPVEQYEFYQDSLLHLHITHRAKMFEYDKEQAILDELYNQEAFVTFDIESTFNCVKQYGVRLDEVMTVFDNEILKIY